jgi:hypothetical protein
MAVPATAVAPAATERLAVQRRASPRTPRALAAVTALLLAAAAVWLALTYFNSRGTNNPNDAGTVPGLPTAAPGVLLSPSPSPSPSPTTPPSVSPSGPALDLPGIHFGGTETPKGKKND